MAHEHHHHHEITNRVKLAIVLGLTAVYMLAEFIGGYITNSLALMADAGHMLSDVGALALSLFALWLAGKPASAEKTYGYYRTEILAAFINGITLVSIALFILHEAYTRFFTPPEVKAPLMIGIATGGLIINIIGAFILHRSSKENLNIQGAFLHILGDLLGSVGTVVAGLIILFFGFNLADPIISIIISLLVLFSAVRLVNNATHVLLEASPSHINLESIKQSLMELPFVDDIHDLHVWSISSSKIALSVHVVTSKPETSQVLCAVDGILREKFGIEHPTIQVEPPGFEASECIF